MIHDLVLGLLWQRKDEDFHRGAMGDRSQGVLLNKFRFPVTVDRRLFLASDGHGSIDILGDTNLWCRSKSYDLWDMGRSDCTIKSYFQCCVLLVLHLELRFAYSSWHILPCVEVTAPNSFTGQTTLLSDDLLSTFEGRTDHGLVLLTETKYSGVLHDLKNILWLVQC